MYKRQVAIISIAFNVFLIVRRWLSYCNGRTQILTKTFTDGRTVTCKISSNISFKMRHETIRDALLGVLIMWGEEDICNEDTKKEDQ